MRVVTSSLNSPIALFTASVISLVCLLSALALDSREFLLFLACTSSLLMSRFSHELNILSLRSLKELVLWNDLPQTKGSICCLTAYALEGLPHSDRAWLNVGHRCGQPATPYETCGWQFQWIIGIFLPQVASEYYRWQCTRIWQRTPTHPHAPSFPSSTHIVSAYPSNDRTSPMSCKTCHNNG